MKRCWNHVQQNFGDQNSNALSKCVWGIGSLSLVISERKEIKSGSDERQFYNTMINNWCPYLNYFFFIMCLIWTFLFFFYFRCFHSWHYIPICLPLCAVTFRGQLMVGSWKSGCWQKWDYLLKHSLCYNDYYTVRGYHT